VSGNSLCAVLHGAQHDHARHAQLVSAQRSAKAFHDRLCFGPLASHAKRLRLQPAALDTAQSVEDMDTPGLRLHPLKGQMPGRGSTMV